MENKVLKNAMWIIVCRMGQAILQLIVGMLTTRYLGPTNYGLINYAASLVAFATPLMQLGMNGILVQEIVNHPEEQEKRLGTAVISCVVSSVFCILGIAIFVYFANAGEKVTLLVCALYSAILMFKAGEMINYWFQAKLLAKYTSIAMLIAYAISAAYQIYLLASGKSIYWFALTKSLDSIVIDVLLVVFLRKNGIRKISFSRTVFREMFQRSKYYIIADLMVVIFAQTDKIMLKMMLGDEATGFYSAAVTCAMITNFVFAAILDSGRPSVFASKEQKQMELNISRLYSIIIYLALAQSLVITLFAPLVVHILCGKAYDAAITPLRIIVWYTTFSYIGSVRNIWMLAVNRQKSLVKINIVGAISNVVLNVVLIKLGGIEGAALASLVTQFFTNVVTGFMFKELRDNNRVLWQGLNPRLCYEMAYKIVKRK